MQFHSEIVNSKFGKFYILDSKKGLHFILKNNDKRVKALIKSYNPIKGLFNKNIIKVFQSNVLGNKIALKFKIKFLECSEFQKIVWKELLKIKQGTTTSYSEIANFTPSQGQLGQSLQQLGRIP